MRCKPAKPAAIDQREIAQRAADAYIELAQLLEAEAKRYRMMAKCYRDGTLLTSYHIPPDVIAHPEMRHPAQRAIDGMSAYDIRAAVERLRLELKGETT